MKPRVILGIDPGVGRMGYGILSCVGERVMASAHGCIETPAHTSLASRLLLIEKKLEQIIGHYHPTDCAIEKLYFAKNTTTALDVAHARGVALLVAARHHLSLQEYSPSQVKLGLTGYGKAEKRQMQEMVRRTLGLKKIPTPDDAADALAIALCGVRILPENRKK